MTPSTSKPAKLLTSLWIRLSCGEGRGGGRGGSGGMPGRTESEKKGEEEAKPLKSQIHTSA